MHCILGAIDCVRSHSYCTASNSCGCQNHQSIKKASRWNNNPNEHINTNINATRNPLHATVLLPLLIELRGSVADWFAVQTVEISRGEAVILRPGFMKCLVRQTPNANKLTYFWGWALALLH
eukprot:3358560-Amphidinium_carterae.1